MVQIDKIYSNEDETKLTVEFLLNSKSRKRGSELLSMILESIISNYFSREKEVESEWIYGVSKKLELKGEVNKFIFIYEIKGKKSTIAIGATY